MRAMCFRGVGQVVLAADDVADLHLLVIDDDHEVVQRHAIGPDDDEVPEQALSKTTSPRMRSSKRIVSGGTRKRTAGRRPWA